MEVAAACRYGLPAASMPVIDYAGNGGRLTAKLPARDAAMLTDLVNASRLRPSALFSLVNSSWTAEYSAASKNACKVARVLSRHGMKRCV